MNISELIIKSITFSYIDVTVLDSNHKEFIPGFVHFNYQVKIGDNELTGYYECNYADTIDINYIKNKIINQLCQNK
jgi:hypothetical protein